MNYIYIQFSATNVFPFLTCATPPNQPRLQLVCQFAPEFKLRALTDPVPDYSLRYGLPACQQMFLPCFGDKLYPHYSLKVVVVCDFFFVVVVC